MINSKIERFLVRSVILSVALNMIVTALTVYHHFVIQNKIDKMK